MQPDSFRGFVRYPLTILTRFCRAVWFHSLAIFNADALTTYFINPPIYHVPHLWSRERTMQPSASCDVRVNTACCVASTKRQKPRSHTVVICSRWLVSRRKARWSSGACDIRSLRALMRSFHSLQLYARVANMLWDDKKKKKKKLFVCSGTEFYHKLQKNFFTIPTAFAKACKMTGMKMLCSRAKQKNDI